MKYYAQFYDRSAIDPDHIVEACGDRAVIILDGRNGRATHNAIAREECKKRGYIGYTIHKGEGFGYYRSRMIQTYITV